MVSIARFSTRFAYAIVDPPLVYPAPTGVKAHFLLTQGGQNWPPFQDPTQFGSGFLLTGLLPGVPINRVRYFPVTFDWWNVTGGKLLPFDHPCPYTAP